MKKLITAGLLGTCLLFGLLLANAEEPSYTLSKPDSNVSAQGSAMTQESTSTSEKTCTTDSGRILKPGDMGYVACEDSLKKKEQMGGVVAPEQMKKEKSLLGVEDLDKKSSAPQQPESTGSAPPY